MRPWGAPDARETLTALRKAVGAARGIERIVVVGDLHGRDARGCAVGTGDTGPFDVACEFHDRGAAGENKGEGGSGRC